MIILKFFNLIAHVFVGFFTVSFFMTGIKVAKSPEDLAKVLVMLGIFSLLGMYPAIIAKRKSFRFLGFKLWLYVTFIPVISWLNILAARPAVMSEHQANTRILGVSEENKKSSIKESFQQVDNVNKKSKENLERIWEKWELEHTKPSQRQRWERALKDCSLVKMLDAEQGVALIKGRRGGEYVASLLNCSCPDFQKRMKPCKHMYLLASHFGLFDPYSTF